MHPASVPPLHRRRAPRLGPSFWIRRYGPQDAAAAGALLLSGAALGGLGDAQLALVAALLELLVFYAVASLRQPRASRLAHLVDEYGPSELIDLLTRPVLLAASLGALGGHPSAALLLGSLAADALFYGLAARRCAERLGRQLDRAAPAGPQASAS